MINFHQEIQSAGEDERETSKLVFGNSYDDDNVEIKTRTPHRQSTSSH